jgi:TRAP-type C4-dicarboxylate transport system substrate-binding protein
MTLSGRVSLVIATLVAFACLSAQASAQSDTITWRVQSHWPQASSSYSDSLEYLRDKLDERTQGRLKLELHPAGSLFGHDEIFNSVRRGVIPMGTISPAYILGEATTAGIANGLPNAFQNTWEAAYFFKHLGFEDVIREEVAEHGVFYSTDKVYPTEMVLTRKVESIDDFRALNVRSSGTLQTFLTDAGAAATMVPGPELYQALSSGVVDGAHWGAVQGALSMSLYEVAKYHVRPPLNIGGIDAFVINQEAIDALPEDIQQILYSTLEEQFWRRTNEYIYQEQVALAKAQAEHDVEVIELPPDVRQAMLDAARTTWENERAKGGKAAEAMDMLESFLRDLGHL